MAAHQVFIPYVTQGAAQLLQTKDFSSGLKARATLKLTMELLSADKPINVDLPDIHLYGPGEAIGCDSLQVVRTEPRPFANDFEPNYFPFVEFDRPDFPWLLTPARATAEGKLRPWIVLVVVESPRLEVRADAPLPVLVANTNELPDLRESWLCAHAQVVLDGSPTADSVADKLSGPPEANLSRLLCMRKLKSHTTYLACVVPAFKTGLQAGLGRVVADNADLEDAWAAEGEVSLPVFFSWEFTTGAEGDFESLARKLRSGDPDLQASFAGRALSLSNPGPGLKSIPDPSNPDDWPRLAGALIPINSTDPPDPSQPFLDSLEKQLNATDPANVGDLDPAMPAPPPLYGRWHAAIGSVNTTANAQPIWFHKLNLQPIYRIAAALGTQIIQQNQEDLMAEAWRQVGEIERANQLQRQAQLSRDVQNEIYTTLFTQTQRKTANPHLTPEQFGFTAPLYSHVRIEEGLTAWGAVNQNATVGPAFDAAFRRLTRSRGPLGRRTASSGRGFTDFAFIINRASAAYTSDPAAERRRGFSFEDVFTVLERPSPDQRLCQWLKGVIEVLQDPDLGIEQPLREAWRVLADIICRSGDRPSRQPEIDFQVIGKALVRELNPEITVVKRLRARVGGLPKDWQPDDPLEPIMVAPKFLIPMYRKLIELSPEYMLPGLGGIPQNTVIALKPNRAFIEAVMVGANHEMSRELRWREFPTDQRGTYFRNFWDPTPARLEKTRDIEEIHKWSKQAKLGENGLEGPVDNLLVLVVRGELLFRYPRTLVYMTKAATGSASSRVLANPPLDEHPLYRGALPQDILFFIFKMPTEEAPGQPGSFFVFQEPPTEVRFGLELPPEEDDESDADITWADLTWGDVTLRGGYIQWAKGPAGRRADHFAALKLPGANEKWSSVEPAHKLALRADQLAGLTRQQPFRIAIHADDLLPP